jgi:hypothetical protein
MAERRKLMLGHLGQRQHRHLRTTSPLTRIIRLSVTVKYVTLPGCHPIKEVQQDGQGRSPDDLRAH